MSEHATCVLVGEAGLLIRGASGSGKSSLALTLIERTRARGGFAALVGDDRVRLDVRGGRVVARADAAIAGLLEIRGLGLVAHPYEAAAVLRLVVDRDAAAERLPDETETWTEILGVRIRRIAVAASDDPAALVLRSCAFRRALRACPG